MAEVVNVEIADKKVARSPTGLVSIGLGSCIGICLYDPVIKVGGLAHIMLPDSTQSKKSMNNAKFADTAVPALLADMIKLGAIKIRIVAKIAGGAQMFSFSNSDCMRIGERNIKATIKALQKAGIPLLAQDTGKNYGRSIRFCTETGNLYIRTITHGEKVI